MSNLSKVLYIGGFELPDKNAAAQRVIGIAKCIRDIGYQVVFINSLKKYDYEPSTKEYFGFRTLEYKREPVFDYLIQGKTAIKIIKKEKPKVVIAYNYPSVALNRIRSYCKKNKIILIADVTEWYGVGGGSFIYKLIKKLDTTFRMVYVHKRVDAVIAISRFLYDYYKPYVPVSLVPPLVDIDDEKWKTAVIKDETVVSFVYAGSPSATKERLDLVVDAVESCAKDENVILHIVGITKSEFIDMYSWKKTISKAVVFWGRVQHLKAVEIVKKARWAIIIRDNNFVVNAGFPTKIVESISCGTPVIVNRFSNISEYLDEKNSIIIKDYGDIKAAIYLAVKKKVEVKKSAFDYRNYVQNICDILVRK